jgi:hypothetical protein
MKIEINYIPQHNQYYAKIYDGPDLIEEEDFLCSSLGEVFEEIVKWRTLISFSYREATANDRTC